MLCVLPSAGLMSLSPHVLLGTIHSRLECPTNILCPHKRVAHDILSGHILASPHSEVCVRNDGHRCFPGPRSHSLEVYAPAEILPISSSRKMSSPAAQKQAGGVRGVHQPEARLPGRRSPLGEALSPLWGCRGAVKTVRGAL